MQIVIDIPDGRYNEIMNDDIYIDVPIFKKDIIATIPEGHGRLIDVDELKHFCKEHNIDQSINVGMLFILLADAPTVIEADTESEVKE